MSHSFRNTSNWGTSKILGNTEKLLYGAEVYKTALSRMANSSMDHSLNSLRGSSKLGATSSFQFKKLWTGRFSWNLGLKYSDITLDSNVKT